MSDHQFDRRPLAVAKLRDMAIRNLQARGLALMTLIAIIVGTIRLIHRPLIQPFAFYVMIAVLLFVGSEIIISRTYDRMRRGWREFESHPDLDLSRYRFASLAIDALVEATPLIGILLVSLTAPRLPI